MITWATLLWSVVESDHTYYCHSQHTNTILMYFDMLQWLALIIETGNVLLRCINNNALSLSLSESTQPPSSESGVPPTSPCETELATIHSLITCAHHLTVCIITVWSQSLLQQSSIASYLLWLPGYNRIFFVYVRERISAWWPENVLHFWQCITIVSSTDTVITLQYSMWCYRWCSYTCTVLLFYSITNSITIIIIISSTITITRYLRGGGGYIKMSNLFLSITVLYSQAPLIFIDHSMWHSCSIQCGIESLAAFDGWNVLTLSHFWEWMIGAVVLSVSIAYSGFSSLWSKYCTDQSMNHFTLCLYMCKWFLHSVST